MTVQEKLNVAHALIQLAYSAPCGGPDVASVAGKRALDLLLELADFPTEGNVAQNTRPSISINSPFEK